MFVGNLDEEGWFIALLISWSVYSRLICLDNQSPLTNVFKLFRIVYRLCQTIYNGFIVDNWIKQYCWSNFWRLLREFKRQIQRFVQLRRQKNCQGTAQANYVCLASASAIILLVAFEQKFKCCITTAWGVTNGTLSMMLTCCQNLMFLRDWRYRDFKLVILLTLSISKLIFILLTLGKSKLPVLVYWLDRS